MNKKTSLLIMIVICLIFASACAPEGFDTKRIDGIKVQYINPDYLMDETIISWYGEVYRKSFVHSVSHIDGYKYILISAGEVPTAGYSLEITAANIENNTIVFDARLIAPNEGSMNAQVISYPHQLLRIKEKEEIMIKANVDITALNANIMKNGEVKGIQGIYVGQADNNFIEIEVDSQNVFTGEGNRIVFLMDDELGVYFEKEAEEYMGLLVNETIIFDAFQTESGQWVVASISRLENDVDNIDEEVLEGEYVGQIDSNSVEIIIEGEPGSFRIGDEIRSMIENDEIETGALVRITIEREGDYRIIRKLGML